MNEVYGKENKQIKARIDGLLAQERFFRLRKKNQNISEEQREKVLQKMNLRQKELMKRESELFRQKDQDRIK